MFIGVLRSVVRPVVVMTFDGNKPITGPVWRVVAVLVSSLSGCVRVVVGRRLSACGRRPLWCCSPRLPLSSPAGRVRRVLIRVSSCSLQRSPLSCAFCPLYNSSIQFEYLIEYLLSTY